MAREEDARIDDMIEELEDRASAVLKLLQPPPATPQTQKRPFFLEFAGTPKAGKTTTVDRLELLLRRNDFRVRVLKETAGTSPSKRMHHPRFNIWTAVTMLGQIIEALDRDDHVVLIDRGMFDALCWMEWFNADGRIPSFEHEAIRKFLCLPRVKRLIDLVFVLTVDPETALKREFAGQLTRRQGQIMNPKTLRALNQSIDTVMRRHRGDFKYVHLDTTQGVEMETLGRLAWSTLDGLAESRDAVLVVPRASLEGLRIPGFISDHWQVERFLAVVRNGSEFVARSEAESNPDLVQVIPITYFQHANRYLLMHRTERDTEDRMHGKHAIWAGGHIRKEDASDGDEPIAICLEREIEEELFVSELERPALVGLVFDSSSDRSRLHIGVVHHVQLNAKMAEPMDGRTFRDPNSASLLVRLVDADELLAHYETMEAWSQLILTEHLRLRGRPTLSG